MNIRYLIPILAGVVAADPAQTQNIHVLPLVGAYRPMQSLPAVRDGDDRYGSKLEGGMVLGVAAEVRLIGPFGVRGTFLRATPDLLVHDTAVPQRAPARVSILAADLVVSGPRVLVATPYLLLGTGSKHYDFTATSLDGAAAEEYEVNRRVRMGHAGVGVRSDFGRVGAVLEIGNYTNSFRAASEPPPGEIPAFSLSWQHDLAYTLGVRVRVR
jgi:hypothetical protein